jgi:transposase
MHYVGCDQHKHYSVVVVKDKSGTMLDQRKLYHNDRQRLKEYFSALPPESSLLLEASGFEPWLCDLLQGIGINVKLAHPFKTRAIAEEKIKTDKLSAFVLADLLRTNFIAEAYIASPQIRQKRYQMRYRQTLVRLKTIIKNKLHSLLDQLGIIVPPVTDLFGKQGRTFLNQLQLPYPYQDFLQNYLQLIDTFKKSIKEVEKDIRKQIQEDKNIKLLMTIPGIGFILGAMIMAEIATIDRFYSSSKLASYAGMIPSLHQSGKVCYSGRITKQGNKYLRWAFIEASHTAIRKDPGLARFYQKLRFKKGSHKAIVAVARKLLTYAFQILKTQKPYKGYPGRA